MKNILKSYFQKQKNVLITMAIVAVSFFIDFIGLLVVIINKQEAVNTFLQTSENTSEMTLIWLLVILGAGLGLAFIFLIGVLFIRTLIPDKKTMSGIMMKDEISFLKNIPDELRKEVEKNGK